MLEATDLTEPLAIVLTPVIEPMKSRLYPVDMCSLLAYDRKSFGAHVALLSSVLSGTYSKLRQ